MVGCAFGGALILSLEAPKPCWKPISDRFGAKVLADHVMKRSDGNAHLLAISRGAIAERPFAKRANCEWHCEWQLNACRVTPVFSPRHECCTRALVNQIAAISLASDNSNGCSISVARSRPPRSKLSEVHWVSKAQTLPSHKLLQEGARKTTLDLCYMSLGVLWSF